MVSRLTSSVPIVMLSGGIQHQQCLSEGDSIRRKLDMVIISTLVGSHLTYYRYNRSSRWLWSLLPARFCLNQ